MERFNQLKEYLDGQKTEDELDQLTKIILKDHYEEIEIKAKWEKILKEEYDVRSFATIEDLVPINKKGRIGKKYLFRSLASIAAVALIFIIAFINFNKVSVSPFENTLQEYYSQPVQYRNTKGKASNSGKRKVAIDNYISSEFTKSSILFQELVSAEDFNEDDHFYLGLSYLYSNQAAKSVSVFENMLVKNNLQREDAIIWFLSLALIETEQFDEARLYLNSIAKWSGNKGKLRKAEQAKELLGLIQ